MHLKWMQQPIRRLITFWTALGNDFNGFWHPSWPPRGGPRNRFSRSCALWGPSWSQDGPQDPMRPPKTPSGIDFRQILDPIWLMFAGFFTSFGPLLVNFLDSYSIGWLAHCLIDSLLDCFTGSLVDMHMNPSTHQPTNQTSQGTVAGLPLAAGYTIHLYAHAQGCKTQCAIFALRNDWEEPTVCRAKHSLID